MDAPFPTDEQQFAADERISFSRLDNKYIAVRDDGAEFEFDATRREWVPADEDDDALDVGDVANGAPPSLPEADSSSRRRRRENGDDGAEVGASQLLTVNCSSLTTIIIGEWNDETRTTDEETKETTSAEAEYSCICHRSPHRCYSRRGT
jgi:HIV Tat-specific factor 1